MSRSDTWTRSEGGLAAASLAHFFANLAAVVPGDARRVGAGRALKPAPFLVEPPSMAMTIVVPAAISPADHPQMFAGVFPTTTIHTRMETFWHWLRLRHLLAETYYSFNPQAYNRLFDDELEKVIARVKDPRSLEHLRGFDWLAYVSSWVRHAGYRDQREVQERTHDVVVKLLTGRLFTGYDPRIHGPMELRFRTSVANAVRNMTQKERNRRRYVPTVSIGQEFVPGGITADDLPAKSMPTDDDEKVIEDFRELVLRRLGGLGLAVLDARLDGEETKSLVGSPALGSPGKWVIKKVVAGIKALAQEFFRGDPDLFRRVEKAMREEGETIGKRRAAMAAARVGA